MADLKSVLLSVFDVGCASDLWETPPRPRSLSAGLSSQSSCGKVLLSVSVVALNRADAALPREDNKQHPFEPVRMFCGHRQE